MGSALTVERQVVVVDFPGADVRHRRRPARHALFIVSVMFLASIIPGLFVWPAFHWISDAMITTGLLVYIVAAWGVAVAVGRASAART